MYLGGVEKEVFLRDLGRDFQELFKLFQPYPRLLDEPDNQESISFDQDIEKFFVFVKNLIMWEINLSPSTIWIWLKGKYRIHL